MKDIEHYEGRVKTVLAQHEQLHQISEQLAPAHGGEQLSAEMADLKEAAARRRGELAEAVTEEQTHLEQINELSSIISSTRASLESAPVAVGTVEQLQAQIEEHNVGWRAAARPGRAGFSCSRRAGDGQSVHEVKSFDWALACVVFYRSVVVIAWWILLTFLLYALLAVFFGVKI